MNCHQFGKPAPNSVTLSIHPLRVSALQQPQSRATTFALYEQAIRLAHMSAHAAMGVCPCSVRDPRTDTELGLDASGHR